MTRPPKHPLNRFATPIDSQLDACKPLAAALARGMKAADRTSLNLTLDACGELATLVAERVSWAAGRGEDSATVQYLEWLNAMETALKQNDVRSPAVNAEHAVILGYNLQAIPTWLGEPSILTTVKRHLPQNATWNHVVSLTDSVIRHPGYLPLRINPSAIEAKMVRLNAAIVSESESCDEIIYVPSVSLLRLEIPVNRAICQYFLETLEKQPMSAKSFRSHIRATLSAWRHDANSRMAGHGTASKPSQGQQQSSRKILAPTLCQR